MPVTKVCVRRLTSSTLHALNNKVDEFQAWSLSDFMRKAEGQSNAMSLLCSLYFILHPQWRIQITPPLDPVLFTFFIYSLSMHALHNFESPPLYFRVKLVKHMAKVPPFAQPNLMSTHATGSSRQSQCHMITTFIVTILANRLSNRKWNKTHL